MAGVATLVVTAPAIAVTAAVAAGVAITAALIYEVADDFPTFRCAGYWYDRCVYRSDNENGAACVEMWNGLAGVIAGVGIGAAVGRAARAAAPYIDDVVRAGKPHLDDLVKAVKNAHDTGLPRMGGAVPVRMGRANVRCEKYMILGQKCLTRSMGRIALPME